MAAPDVVIKCEEFIENDVTPQDTDTFFNIYENADENDQENDENRRVDIDYEDDDTKMQALLREFDLEILYTILKIGDITYRSLKYISENDINAAIRSIAYRAEFREKLFAWRRDKYGLNDYSVLPPSKNTMPLGVNNSNNIQSYYTNNHHSNVVPHSRVAPNSYDHITAMAQRHSTGQTQRRRLSNQKINSAKKPRVANTMQEKQSNQATNSAQQQQHQQQQHQQQHPQQPHQQQPHQQQPHQQQPHQQQPQQHQHQPPSPTQTASRLSSQFSQGERSLTSPTPTISDTMSLLQQENSRLDSHQSMDYDDPLCYQPTTSSAAAAAAAGVPTASMKTDDSPYVPQPKMTYEKLQLKSSPTFADEIPVLNEAAEETEEAVIDLTDPVNATIDGETSVLSRILNEVMELRKENLALKACGADLYIPLVPKKPFVSLEEFKKFEKELRASPDTLKRLIAELRQISCISSDKFVRTCWRKIFVDEVAEQFSWRGTATKDTIRELALTQAIRTAFRQKFNLSDEDFDRITQRFFQYAHDRLIKSKKYESQKNEKDQRT